MSAGYGKKKRGNQILSPGSCSSLKSSDGALSGLYRWSIESDAYPASPPLLSGAKVGDALFSPKSKDLDVRALLLDRELQILVVPLASVWLFSGVKHIWTRLTPEPRHYLARPWDSSREPAPCRAMYAQLVKLLFTGCKRRRAVIAQIQTPWRPGLEFEIRSSETLSPGQLSRSSTICWKSCIASGVYSLDSRWRFSTELKDSLPC